MDFDPKDRLGERIRCSASSDEPYDLRTRLFGVAIILLYRQALAGLFGTKKTVQPILPIASQHGRT